MARVSTVQQALTYYLSDKNSNIDVWLQPPYRNICAFVGERLLAIAFEVYYRWPDDVSEIRSRLEANAVYETLLNVAEPATTVLNWTARGLTERAKM